jgi:glyoxylase-like metal-dependent hydrolase (beta-lactamase superfamily II)
MTIANTQSRHAWSEPGIEEVTDGVHRVPLPMPSDALRAVNVYALHDDERVVLIDAGNAVPGAREQLSWALAQIGHQLADVTDIAVTHFHQDHYSLGVGLRRDFGCRLLLGEGEQANFAAIREMGLEGRESSTAVECRQTGADELLADLADTLKPPDLQQWPEPDIWVSDTTELTVPQASLRAIHTPGHSSGHLVFHDHQRKLTFTGDHVLPHITPSIGYEPAMNRQALADYLRSLHTMLTLGDGRLLPAHGPLRDSTHHRVTELLDHHEQRLHATLEAVGRGPATAYEAAQKLRWTRRERHFDELEPYHRYMATAETAAHLEVLVIRGFLQHCRDDSEVHRYAAT